MDYRYYAQRFRYLPDGRRVGTLGVGEIIYIQEGVLPFFLPKHITCREPWRLEAWIPPDFTIWDPVIERHKTVRCAGGHLALMRSLRDSRRTKYVADWILLACVEAGLTR
jgi:hypothetical protein